MVNICMDMTYRWRNMQKLVYVLVDVGNPVKVKKLLDRYNRDIDEGKKVPEVIMIDSTSKESASIT